MLKALLCTTLLLCAVSAAFASAPTRVSCEADCSTEKKAADADETGNCFATDRFELDLDVDGDYRQGAWNSKAGWDGDQYLSQSFDSNAIKSLNDGAREIIGTQREGFNHGPDCISEYEIKCVPLRSHHSN